MCSNGARRLSRRYLDTDHPVFRQEAPEYVDSIFDVFLERIANRWSRVRDLGRQDALSIVREEAMQLFTRKADRGGTEPRHIVAVLANIVDSATPMAQLDAVCYCYGMLGRSEESMDAIAKRHGISRQAFSKKVERIIRDFGIAPRGGMRPERQRDLYQDIHRKRWDHIEQDAPKKCQA